MDKVANGKVYFKLDDSTETKELLNDFFHKLGFKSKPISIDKYGFSRQTEFSNPLGIKFTIVWFVNLAHVRFGTWDSYHFESSFTSIRGSWVQNSDQATFQFYYKDEPTISFSIPYSNILGGL